MGSVESPNPKDLTPAEIQGVMQDIAGLSEVQESGIGVAGSADRPIGVATPFVDLVYLFLVTAKQLTKPLCMGQFRRPPEPVSCS